MIDIPSETVIEAPAERVFDVIVDLGGQDRWLTPSSAYHGTTDISSSPATVGTTYREPAPAGVRSGTVTECERPTKVTFHQPMKMKMGAGTLDSIVRYTLTPEGNATRVKRDVALGVSWQMKLMQPILVRAFRTEGNRVLLALKEFAEKPS